MIAARRMRLFGVLLCLFATSSTIADDTPPTTLRVAKLRCEYLVDPLGIDVAAPRLNWVVESDERGQRQTAYRIRVTSDVDRVDGKPVVLWDTGRVVSDRTVQIEYAGKPLASHQWCLWNVMVWDGDGRPSPWSDTARWSMGLLDADQWQAKWIGRDEPETAGQENPLSAAVWIWHDEPATGLDYPVGKRFFRKTFAVPNDRRVVRASCCFTADNGFELFLGGRKLASGSNFKSAQLVDVTEHVSVGESVVAIVASNVGDAPNPAAVLGVLRIEFDRGEPIVVATDTTWQSTDREPPQWPVAASDDGFSPAKRVAGYGEPPWGDVSLSDEDRVLPARMLRREFNARGKPVRATASICGLGYYELYVNGKRIGDHVLDPVLTQYDKRVPYVTYDVTEQVAAGANAVGVILGNGRYFAPRLKVPTGTRTFGYPKLLLKLRLEFADGSSQVVASDDQWRLTTDGPIRENNDYDGEVYDARREMPGWAKTGFDAADWQPVVLVDPPKGKLVAQMMPPMRITQELKPVAVTQPKPGVWIFDMGQNLVGWCRMRVEGPAGTRVQLRHAETLSDDGLLYTANLRSAKCRDVYTLKGDGIETYEPRFAYHGFRFVELTGYPGTPDASTLTACVVHTDLPPAGKFACSNPILTRMHQNIQWGLRGNYLSIPTDCPQRDERQGWQGDRAAESKGEAYLFDNVTLYNKWLVDIHDSQRDDGLLSDVCPNFWPLYGPNVTWPSAFTIVPQTMHVHYGDRRNIELHFEAMMRWMDLLAESIRDGVIDRDNYGDWCVPPERPELIHSQDPARKTSKVVLATCYYIHNLDLLADYANMLDRPEDAVALRQRSAAMRKAFNAKLFNAETGLYDNGTQTSCVLPLAFGIAPPSHRGALFDNLVQNIVEKTDHHIGTGLIGGQWLMRTLSDHGRIDLAYRIAGNTTYPSWGYMIENDATTVWELWNGNTADPAMNSGNHVMLVGDLAIWMYEYLAGIQADPQHPAMAHIIMRPHPVGDLTFVEAEHRSVRGLIRSTWRIDQGRFDWRITVPANATASVSVPTADRASVTESGRPAVEVEGVEPLAGEPGRAVFRIGAGSYRFQATAPD